MFSKADADHLRQNLTGIEFLSGSDAAAPKLGPGAAKRYAAYIEYYGLDFGRRDAALAGVRATIGTFNSGPFDLVCQHFVPAENPPQKTAFLLHGYFDHAGLYRHLIGHLLHRGIAVVIFDLPGHGLSSGATATIDSFQEYSDALVVCLKLARAQQLSTPWVALGQSTGGAVIIEALLAQSLQPDYPFQHTILLAPLLRPRHWSRSRILFSLSKLFVTSTPRKFSRNSHDEEFLQFLESEDELQSRILPRDWVQAMIAYINRFEKAPIQELALQIIQGEGDGTVEWERNVPAIVAKFPGSEVHRIEEAGHHLVNESRPYRDQLFAHIDRILDTEQAQA